MAQIFYSDLQGTSEGDATRLIRRAWRHHQGLHPSRMYELTEMAKASHVSASLLMRLTPKGSRRSISSREPII